MDLLGDPALPLAPLHADPANSACGPRGLTSRKRATRDVFEKTATANIIKCLGCDVGIRCLGNGVFDVFTARCWNVFGMRFHDVAECCSMGFRRFRNVFT